MCCLGIRSLSFYVHRLLLDWAHVAGKVEVAIDLRLADFFRSFARILNEIWFVKNPSQWLGMVIAFVRECIKLVIV